MRAGGRKRSAPGQRDGTGTECRLTRPRPQRPRFGGVGVGVVVGQTVRCALRRANGVCRKPAEPNPPGGGGGDVTATATASRRPRALSRPFSFPLTFAHARPMLVADAAAAATLAALRSRHTATGPAPCRTPVRRVCARPRRFASIGNNILSTTTRTRISCVVRVPSTLRQHIRPKHRLKYR